MLMSKSVVSGGRPLIANGYKYNVRKVVSFIVIEVSGNTKSGLPYLSKDPDQFSIFSIRPVACTLVMYKFFGSVNEVESHNKSRQSDSSLEKFWVAQCIWLCLCTTVHMGMTITNCWKLFCYGVKRDCCEKSIGIREFLEQLALDCFNNTFSTDTWYPDKEHTPP